MVCFVPGCGHKNRKENNCSFFRFPTNYAQRCLWAKMCRRADRAPTDSDRICSCHFEDGEKRNMPTIFLWNVSRNFTFPTPPSRKRQHMQTEEDSDDPPTPDTDSDDEPSVNPYLQKIPLTIPHVQKRERIRKSFVDMNTTIKQDVSIEYVMYLQAKVNELEARLKVQQPFRFSQVKKDPSLFRRCTGLADVNSFKVILDHIQKFEFSYFYEFKVKSMKLEDQLFIFLLKMRNNFTFLDIANRFCIGEKTVRNIFVTLLYVLHETLFQLIMENPENQRPLLDSSSAVSLPKDQYYVIDIIEVKIQKPRSSKPDQKITKSFKKGQTFKGLTAMSPNGALCFCSDLFPGSYTDRDIFSQSGFASSIAPGHVLLADRAFMIDDLVPEGVLLIMPPFQMLEDDFEQGLEMSQVKLQIERLNQRIKVFEILKCISRTMMTHGSKIFQVCSMLGNFQVSMDYDVSES